MIKLAYIALLVLHALLSAVFSFIIWPTYYGGASAEEKWKDINETFLQASPEHQYSKKGYLTKEELVEIDQYIAEQMPKILAKRDEVFSQSYDEYWGYSWIIFSLSMMLYFGEAYLLKKFLRINGVRLD